MYLTSKEECVILMKHSVKSIQGDGVKPHKQEHIFLNNRLVSFL